MKPVAEIQPDSIYEAGYSPPKEVEAMPTEKAD
jgi:hypothetical protein